MTQLVYVPKSLVRVWKRRGWGVVFPGEEYDDKNKKWAVLMHPPGWPESEQKPLQIEDKTG